MDFKGFVFKTISLEEKIYTITILIELYLLKKLTSYLSSKIIALFICNICIFYSIIDKIFPYFLFKCTMSIHQIIEGIIVLITCIIPTFEKKQKEKKQKNE